MRSWASFGEAGRLYYSLMNPLNVGHLGCFFFCYSKPFALFKITLCTKLWIFPGDESLEMEFQGMMYSSLWSFCPSTLEPLPLLVTWASPRHRFLWEAFSPLPRHSQVLPGGRPRGVTCATSPSKMPWAAQELQDPHQNCGLLLETKQIGLFSFLSFFVHLKTLGF